MNTAATEGTFRNVGIHRLAKMAIELAMGEANRERPSGHRHSAEPLPDEALSHHRQVDIRLAEILRAKEVTT